MQILKAIDTDRRSFIPLRILYLCVSAGMVVGSALLLLNKGFWGIFAFCCINTPFLVISVYWKDGKLKRLNETIASFAETFWPLC